MQNEQVPSNLEEQKLDEPILNPESALIPVETPEEVVDNKEVKNKKATIAAVAAGIVGAAAGTALGAQNADAISNLINFDNDEPLTVEPDPDPNAPANTAEPVAQADTPEPVAEPTLETTPEQPTDTTNESQAIPVDINGDGVDDVLAVDANQDGLAEGMAIDQNNDGVIDTVYVDTDNDGDLDLMILDENQDGNPDFEGALDQEITLELTPNEAVPEVEPTAEAPTDLATEDLATTDLPQDEFDPNADMSDWA